MRLESVRRLAFLMTAALVLATILPHAFAAESECQEPNEKLDQACTAQPGVVTGTLDPDGDVDRHWVNVPSGGAVLRATLICPTLDCDLYLGVVGPDNVPTALAKSAKFGRTTEAAPEEIEADLGEGQYYLSVESTGGPWGPAARYSLSLHLSGGPSIAATPTSDVVGMVTPTTQAPCPGEDEARALTHLPNLRRSGMACIFTRPKSPPSIVVCPLGWICTWYVEDKGHVVVVQGQY